MCPPYVDEIFIDMFDLVDYILMRNLESSFLAVLPDWIESLWYARTMELWIGRSYNVSLRALAMYFLLRTLLT